MITTYLDFFQTQGRIAVENGKEVSAVKLLMLKVTGTSAVAFNSSLEELITESQQDAFFKLFDQYLNGKPVAYILGEQYFYGHVFKVNPSVLIPRMETELLVEWIDYDLRQFDSTKSPVVVDIGTGSGAIAIALKKQHEFATVIGTDISSEALAVAIENGNELKASIEWLKGDFLEPIIQKGIKVDYLISNPPYVSEGDEVDPSVLQYEPHLALFAEEGGMASYRRILEKASLVMKPQGKIYFEIGSTQKGPITQMIHDLCPHSTFTIEKDYSGHDRIVIITYKE